MPLRVQTLVLQLGRAFLTGLLVLLAVGLLTIHAAVFDEEAGGAVLKLDGAVSSVNARAGAGVAVRANASHF